MNVTCPSCETVYRVDPGKIPPGGLRARCAVCSNVFPVNVPAGAAAVLPRVADTAPPVAAAQRAPAAPGGVVSAPPRMPPLRSPAAAPPAPTPAPAPPRPPAMPRFSGPVVFPPAAPPPGPSRTPPLPPGRPVAAPASPPPPTRPRPAAAPPPGRPSAPTMRPAAAPAAAPAGGPAPGQRLTGPLPPVTPFLVQDPKRKPRRLARALVSDLPIYHPEKRQQGLR